MHVRPRHCVPPQLFFASVGASGDIRVVLATAPALFLWSAVAISAHMALCLLFERLWRYSRREMALASNANVGGELFNLIEGRRGPRCWVLRSLYAALDGLLAKSGASPWPAGCGSCMQGPPPLQAWRQPRAGGRAWCPPCWWASLGERLGKHHELSFIGGMSLCYNCLSCCIWCT